jgi:localization factor PodJL
MLARTVGRLAGLALAIALLPGTAGADVIDRVGNALDRTGSYIGRKLGVDHHGNRATTTSSGLIEESRPPTVVPSERAAAAANLRDALARQDVAASDADRASAAALLATAAERGDPDAQYILGLGDSLQPATERDPERAARWLARAASQGHARAQYALAQAYIDGSGVRRDPAWANMWLERAARRGHGPSQRALALRMLAGEGGPANETEAYRWLAIAVASGQSDAARYRDALGVRLESANRAAIDAEAAAFHPVMGAEAWPDPALVRYVQTALAARGFDAGPPDGVWGRRTRAALVRYAGGDGRLSPPVVARLRAG